MARSWKDMWNKFSSTEADHDNITDVYRTNLSQDGRSWVCSISQQGNTVPPPRHRKRETVKDGIADNTIRVTLLDNAHTFRKPSLLFQDRNNSALLFFLRCFLNHFRLKSFQVFLQNVFCEPPVDAVASHWEETYTRTSAKREAREDPFFRVIMSDTPPGNITKVAGLISSWRRRGNSKNKKQTNNKQQTNKTKPD